MCKGVSNGAKRKNHHPKKELRNKKKKSPPARLVTITKRAKNMNKTGTPDKRKKE